MYVPEVDCIVITPELDPIIDIVVKLPVLAVVFPIGPGFANVFPDNELAFKFATLVVELIINGAVPVKTVDLNIVPVNWELSVSVVPVASPRTGVTNVGLFVNTTDPDPVDVVTPVPPELTGIANPE